MPNFTSTRISVRSTNQSFSPLGDNATDRLCLLLLTSTWVFAVLLVNPIGNFPLNDDWAYGFAVRNLLETGDLRFSGWTGGNQVAQVIWGALFCLPFGFSFTALRLSTLVLGLIGVLATYGLLRETRASAGLALFGALVVAFDPIYFSLANTFMTDVPFAAVATTSSWFLLRGLRRDSGWELAAGLLFSGIAILIRQVGFALPIGFAMAHLAKRGLSVRRMVEALLPLLAAIVLQVGYEAWLKISDRLPANFGKQIGTIWIQLDQGWPFILKDAAIIASFWLTYLGLFLFPFVLLAGPPRRQSGIFIALASLAITAGLAVAGELMPLHGNILTKGGIGWDPVQAPSPFWLGATFISICGAILLSRGITRAGKKLWKYFIGAVNCGEPWVLVFALGLVVASFAPLVLLGLGKFGFYDRYLIIFVPWLMLSLVAATICRGERTVSRSAMSALAGIALLTMAVFSIAATHDYLSSNRVLWTALNQLMRDGIGPEKIDGGFEFNGWYLYSDAYIPHPPQNWYWVESDDFYVSQYTRDGYVVLRTYPVDRLLPWGRVNVLVQKRAAPPQEH